MKIARQCRAKYDSVPLYIKAPLGLCMPASDNTLSSKKKRFRWLHLSDIHVGVSRQPYLWPRFSRLLDADLEKLLRRVGNIDLIVFSGDMVQGGSREEYDLFDQTLGKIIDRISDVQARPQVVALPGNHDLVRPDALSGQAFALKAYWDSPEIRERFWDAKGQEYRTFIDSVFENYTAWQRRLIDTGTHVAPEKIGVLPGDASYLVNTSSGTLGIAALNSTWLQLGAGDYTGKLHVDARQLLAITHNDPDRWAQANDVSLLVTHQPPDWLHPSSPSSWENDVNPSGRFDAHMFGHMHTPNTMSVTHGGNHARRSLQAASLFGMEYYGEKHERIQGYSLCEIAIVGEQRNLTVWPRTLIDVAGGEKRLGQDLSQGIDEETGSFSLAYSLGARGKHPIPALEHSPPDSLSDADAVNLTRAVRFDLETIRFAATGSKAHFSVRQLERDVVIGGLIRDRVAWLASDWGMGHEGFIASIREKLGISPHSVFALDFDGYRDRTSYFERLQTLFGVSFQEICEAIADAGPSILLFDDLDLPSINVIGGGAELDVERLARAVSDFAAETTIIIRTRRPVRFASFAQVELKSLDEADVGVYAAASEIGGPKYSKPEAASKLFRHTDGVPNRIDVALRDLEIISLDDLMDANPDFSASGNALIEAPAALVATVSELRASEDRQDQRAWHLLLALSTLPHGEQLARLRRFLGPHPITVTHAHSLVARSLISTVSLATFEGMGGEPSRTLVVPRPVREYVRNIIDEKTAADFEVKALELYFGDQWMTGDIYNSPAAKRARQPLCDTYEIQNANTLILRAVRRSLEEKEALPPENVARLALAFVDALEDGDHFRSIVGLCEDVLDAVGNDDSYEREVNLLRYEYARSLRMTSRLAEARTNFEQLNDAFLTKKQRQSVQLGLALVLDRQGDEPGAVEAAKRVIAIDRKSASALHASAIIAEQIQDNGERVATLKKILVKAQKDDNQALANNISLSLAANRRKMGLASDDLLKQIVVTQKKTGDFYNAARAIVELARQSGAVERLTAEERTHLIEAYHYLFHERLFNLFDKCHAALWELFTHDGDSASLLNLFRHSSFIWRLSGREEQETKYLEKLGTMFGDIIAGGVSQTTRDGAYFIVRISIVLGPQSSDTDDEVNNETRVKIITHTPA
ncbi:metallophosphoesterase [Agrobacterium tumefaciens]